MQSSDSKKGKKGRVVIFVEKGRIKVNLPRQYFGGQQKKIGLGMDASPDNMARAERIAQRMTMDLQDGCFDLTLEKYGIKARLNLSPASSCKQDDEPPQKTSLSILEIWGTYCEYKKHKLAITTYENCYKKRYTKFISDAIDAVGEDALAIRTWLVSNRNGKMVKDILSQLSKAYKLAIKQGSFPSDPFDGLHMEIENKRRIKEIKQGEADTDDDVLEKDKAFTWEEAKNIMEYVRVHPRMCHWYSFISFKFLTGCRTGEAIAFWWNDVKWDEEKIFIRRNYDNQTRIFKPTKNEHTRIFPMPENGELWQLLKSIPRTGDIVFLGRGGRIIEQRSFHQAWKGRDGSIKGIIPALIEQGKVKKYLPPYNTRHTFINHQINDMGIPPHVVNAWCEHSDQVSKTHYRQLDLRVIPGYGEKKESDKSETELLREQIELLTKRLDELGG